jgi:hypothetical protein
MCPAWESLSGHGYPECPGKATFPKRSALQSFALPDPGCGIERDVGALKAIVGVTEANVVLTALSVCRAVGSRTSMSITSTPGSARLSASGLSSIE